MLRYARDFHAMRAIRTMNTSRPHSLTDWLHRRMAPNTRCPTATPFGSRGRRLRVCHEFLARSPMARDDDGMGPKIGQKRAILYVLALFFVFLEAGLYAARQQSTPRAAIDWTSALKRGESSKTIDHPIPKLMAEAEDKFRNLLERQSKTLGAAVAEYRRRYGRDPPKGFDDWWTFARSRDVKMIDDYDAINEDLSPFWNFSGTELRRRVNQVSSPRLSFVVRC